ncbi:MAG: ATPase P [Deltaproteobacteria bacterium]|nr:ATPase P [Deltaproteobacteria bacterium]
MIEISVPGGKTLLLSFLVLDYNGTMACDGRLIQGVRDRLEKLSSGVEIHVLTADTFGSVRDELTGIPCRLTVIPKDDQAQAKADFIRGLGVGHTVAVGNGRNDQLMLQEAVLGIATLQEEGAAPGTLFAADVVTHSILDALDLLLFPIRMTATLRS